ncbi:MAG TPA: alpha/beta hydrolase [Pseudonocardia sp.]|nr:alpha/beta hydrolase [Pseudonocardia sp.]
MSELTTHVLDAPGARLYYDIRASDIRTNARTSLLLLGSPMGAAGFGTLAGHFDDRTVVTYDPRGSERSVRTDGAATDTPDEHADDLRRLIETLEVGPVDIFASSGGAVNALALISRHPGLVRTLVAHEPPATQQLPDRGPALAACRDIHRTYLRDGYGPAMAKFITLVSHQGEFPPDFAERAAPNPAQFGLPEADDGSRGDPLLGRNIVSCNQYVHDVEALRTASAHLVLGVGAASGDTLAARAPVALSRKLDITPTPFPGDHVGFLGGEYGMTGVPDAFSGALRQVLDD